MTAVAFTSPGKTVRSWYPAKAQARAMMDEVHGATVVGAWVFGGVSRVQNGDAATTPGAGA